MFYPRKAGEPVELEKPSGKKEVYDRDGFAVMECFFSSSEMEHIVGKLDDFITNTAPQLIREEINYTKTGVINSIHRLGGEGSRFPSFFTELLHGEKMISAAEYFLGDEAVPRKVEYFAKPAHDGMKSPWHQDNFYWCVDNANALTFWLALDTASIENGGVRYVAGSQTWGLLNHVDSFAPGSSQRVEDLSLIEKHQSNIVCPSIKPGDMLVHHSLTVHGSEDNTSNRSRRGITFSYRGKSSSYDQKRLSDYLSRLKKQVDDRSKGNA